MQWFRWLAVVMAGTAATLCWGCFAPQDAIADRALVTAIGDMRTMAAQDEQMERNALEAARQRGIAAIEARRNEVGKSLEGGLLTWQNAEKVNNAFGQVRSDFDRAVEALGGAITVKYSQRAVPIAVTGEYLEYSKVRRDALQYVGQGFVEGMGKDLPAMNAALGGLIEKMTKAGLPTSVSDLQGWLQQRVADCASGNCAPLK